MKEKVFTFKGEEHDPLARLRIFTPTGTYEANYKDGKYHGLLSRCLPWREVLTNLKSEANYKDGNYAGGVRGRGFKSHRPDHF